MQSESRKPDPKLDALLDAALRGYGRSEPRGGLEERVLARLRAEPDPKPLFGWRWRAVGAGAVAAVVIFAIVLRVERAPWVVPPQSTQRTQRNADVGRAAGKPVLSPATGTPRSRPRVARSARPEAAPRLAQFPSPSAPTAQELLLARLASADPAQMAALSAANNDGIRPLKIEPLEPGAEETQAPALPQNPGRGNQN